MKIGIPVADYHRGNPAEFLSKGLLELGCETRILNVTEFVSAFHNKQFDFFVCVDSSKGINFESLLSSNSNLESVAMWYIDYRHNKNRQERMPEDSVAARQLLDNGGRIFQAQYEDYQELSDKGYLKCSWLPLAADPAVWMSSSQPKDFDLGFIGHIWDGQRGRVLEYLAKLSEIKFAFAGHGKLWGYDAASLLGRCRAGFNINTFFPGPQSYDINMRFFETLSCGIPLITNEVPSLDLLLNGKKDFVRTYRTDDSFKEFILAALSEQSFIDSGLEARQWILENATYMLRAKTILEIISKDS